MKKINIIIYFIISIPFGIVNAQKVKPISKQEVIEKVQANNIALKITEQDYNLAKADFNQSRAVFLPTIGVSYTGITTTSPLMVFGIKLNQEVVVQNDFVPDLLNNPERINNFATKIEVQQPIINIDGFYKRKAAKIKMGAVNLQGERTKDYLLFEVEKAYMQLQLAYKGVEVLEKAVVTAMANQKMATNSFEQGYLQKADVLAVNVRVTEVKNQLQNAKSNVANASNYLSFLMHEDNSIVLKPSDSLQVVMVSLEEHLVSENRSDIKAMQIATNAYETMMKSDKMAYLPRLNAFGAYEVHTDKIFTNGATNYLIGAQLSWTIFEGSKRSGKLQQSKANLEKSKLELEQYISKSKLELMKAKRMFSDAENKLNLSKLAKEQSKESLRIRTNRFQQGLEKTSDILISETQYAQKQLEYYQTIFEYNYAQAYIHFLTK